MINTDDLCMSCMKEIGNAKQCPHCGFHADSPQISPYLPIRTVVSNRYLVGKLLEFNGEGATYIGWDLSNRVPVTIREFLPDAIANRTQGSLELAVMTGCDITFSDCCQSFLEMWRKLARLRGLSALISVIDIVEDYGTAYAVSEYFGGVPLREFLLLSKTGYITWEKARQLFMPVLSTLGTLHSSGIIHRGISPTTLLIGKDGKVRISGFSIWQARTARGELTAQLFPGYAAIEQYGFEGQQGPWTDIYAFAAVLYRSLIGTDPLEATARAANDRLMVPAKFAEQLPAYVINALINALQIMPNDRTRTVEQLRADLSASPSAALAGENFTKTAKQELQRPASDLKSKKAAQKEAKTIALKAGLISLGVGLVIFAILAATVFKNTFFNGGNPDNETLSSNATTVADQVTVPDFVGGDYSSVSSNPVWTKIFSFKSNEVFSKTVAVGTIISQNIQPDTAVSKGTEIVLTVSKGKEMVQLPNVVGLDYALAEKQLKDLGFTCDKVDKANDGTAVANSVYAQSPIAEQKYEKGTKIYLQVWTDTATTSLSGETTTGT